MGLKDQKNDTVDSGSVQSDAAVVAARLREDSSTRTISLKAILLSLRTALAGNLASKGALAVSAIRNRPFSQSVGGIAFSE